MRRWRGALAVGGLLMAVGVGGAQTGYQYEQLAPDPVLKTPETLDSMIMRAGYEQRHRDCLDAGLHTDTVLALKPNWAGARALKLYCEREEHRRVDELADLTRLITLQPKKWLWWSDRANVHHLDGDWKAALADMKQAIALQPWRVELYARRSRWEDEIQDYAGAFGDLETIRELLPEQAGPLADMAEYALKHGRSKSVTLYLQMAEIGSPKPEDSPRRDDDLATDGMSPDELMLRAGYAKSLRKWALELRFLDAALQLRPGLVRALEMRLELAMGRSYYSTMSYSEADSQALERLNPRQDVDRLIALDSRRGDYYRFRIDIISNSLRPPSMARMDVVAITQVLKDFATIIELEPDEGTSYAGRGQFEVERSPPDTAIKDFIRAIELNPSNASYCYELSRAYAQKRALLTQALALNWALIGEPENVQWLAERSKLP
jgi:tetratricopeptide (TPR) repeat protein